MRNPRVDLKTAMSGGKHRWLTSERFDDEKNLSAAAFCAEKRRLKYRSALLGADVEAAPDRQQRHFGGGEEHSLTLWREDGGVHYIDRQQGYSRRSYLSGGDEEADA